MDTVAHMTLGSLGMAVIAAVLGGCGGGDADSLARPAASERRQIQAVRTPSATQLFDWAEKAYAPYFPGHKADQTVAPYTYRYYPETGNYLGVSGDTVAIYGPVSQGQLLVVGRIADFACLVSPADCSLPAISTQPAATQVLAPQQAVFSVVATGSPAPSYQWQQSSDGGQTFTDIAGATAASYTLARTSLADSGKRFRVRIRNLAGEVLSASALLTVEAAPTSAPALTPTGIGNAKCFAAGASALASCGSAAALALSGPGKQDGMIGGAFAYAEVPKPTGGTYPRTECVLDTLTGLTWSGHQSGTYRDSSVRQTNYGDNRSGDVSAYVGGVNFYALCGYKDWRIPTAEEFATLVNFALAGSATTIDIAWFPETAFSAYWTVTPSISPLVPLATFSYRVDFTGGSLGNAQVYLKYAVRFVRGGRFMSAASRFTPNADGSEVRDARTGLVWRRCVEGMVWTGSRCSGSAIGLSHEEALVLARQHAGWRLPNVKELFSIADLGLAEPTLDAAAFPNSPFQGFWSSTPLSDHEAWSVDFYRGGFAPFERSGYPARSAKLVRLVRTGKDPQTDLSAPVLRTQPRPAWVSAPRAATFSAAAVGSPEPTYQWQQGDGAGYVDIPGANGPTHILPSTSPADHGKWFRVRVSNARGEATSDAVQLTVSTAAPSPIPPTGIGPTLCYKRFSNQLVPCASAEAIELGGAGKQDGMFGMPFAFAEVPQAGGGYHPRHECVKDEVTGLTWEGKPFDGGLRDPTRMYTNYGDKRAGDASAYVDAVNALALCGYTDWRLPTIAELLGILDYSKGWPGPLLDWDWMPNAHPVHGLWSATRSTLTDANHASYYWVLSIDDGNYGDNAGSPTSLGVRLVRGGVAPLAGPRFVPSANGGEITDRLSGLVWRRCLEGMSWTGSTCKGVSLNFTQEQALDHARQQAGWRLPNIKELASLVDFTQQSPEIDSTAFPNLVSDVTFHAPNLWSSTPRVGDGSAVVQSTQAPYGWLMTLKGSILYAGHNDAQLARSTPGWGALLVRMP